MNELVLRSWELPVGCTAPLSAPVDALATIEWRGQNVTAKIRAVKIEKGVWWLFFQPENEWGHNYLVRHDTSSPLEPASWKAPEPAEKWARLVKMAVREDQFSFARFFYFGAPQNAVYVWNELRHLKNSWECGWIGEFYPIAEFDVWPNVQNRNSYEVHQWILKQWQKPTSQVRFAWQWAQWREETRHKFLYPHPDGINELIKVMEWVLKSDLNLDNDKSWEWFFDDYLRTSDHSVDTYHSSEVSPRLGLWNDFLFNFFDPLPESRIFRPPLCVREWDMIMRVHILARREPLSHHEQLEARHKLREWLESNAPDQIARLLPG